MKFRTRAKTAYGLLSEIRKLILEEPMRYNQGDTLNIAGKRHSFRETYAEYPACGTVGCVAGWTTALKSARPARVDDVLEYAHKKLGLTVDQAYALFRSDAAGLVFGPTRVAPQTREHAERGAAHIAKFQQDNAAQLKRTKL